MLNHYTLRSDTETDRVVIHSDSVINYTNVDTILLTSIRLYTLIDIV